jgi:hypothetical protein
MSEQNELKPIDLRMDAYYYFFDETGVPAIDRILSAVACAGKSYHQTEDWNEAATWDGHTGETPIGWIQNAANEAALAYRIVDERKTDEQIRELALANGFKLKEQPDGTMNLNPYVYDFARALMGSATNPEATTGEIRDAAPTDERAAFETWATHPNRGGKLPIDRHPNDAYSDVRTYTAWYGWCARALMGKEGKS